MSAHPTKTITLCGSLRHATAMQEAAQHEENLGHRVLQPQRANLDRITLSRRHLARIDEADEVLVVNPDGHIGESTAAEIAYALHTGKPVRYTEETNVASDPRAALEALLDECDGCGCLGEAHAHRAEQALRRVLDLEAPQRHPMSPTDPAVHPADVPQPGDRVRVTWRRTGNTRESVVGEHGYYEGKGAVLMYPDTVTVEVIEPAPAREGKPEPTEQPSPGERSWEFRLSPDRREIAIWEPGNEPWFIPEPGMSGRFVSDHDVKDWTPFRPA